MKKDKTLLIVSVSYFLLSAALLISVVGMKYQRLQINQLQSDQAKIEKRINNLSQAMQTKNKELEDGMRNNYTGLMYKIEFLEREIGVSE